MRINMTASTAKNITMDTVTCLNGRVLPRGGKTTVTFNMTWIHYIQRMMTCLFTDMLNYFHSQNVWPLDEIQKYLKILQGAAHSKVTPLQMEFKKYDTSSTAALLAASGHCRTPTTKKKMTKLSSSASWPRAIRFPAKRAVMLTTNLVVASWRSLEGKQIVLVGCATRNPNVA